MNALELKLPPALVLAAFALLAWFLDLRWPEMEVRIPGSVPVAFGLVAIGTAILAGSLIHFIRSDTTVDPRTPGKATTLVVGGIYKRSRNPMYVGFACLLLAALFRFSNAAAFVAFPGFILFIHRFQIRPEERFLEAKFGEAYRAYKRRVRAWI